MVRGGARPPGGALIVRTPERGSKVSRTGRTVELKNVAVQQKNSKHYCGFHSGSRKIFRFKKRLYDIRPQIFSVTNSGSSHISISVEFCCSDLTK